MRPLATLAVLATPLGAQNAPPCAVPARAELAFLEGSWTVQSRFRLSAEPAEWETGTASAEIVPLMRGCAVLERYRGTRRGRPYEAIRLFAAREAPPELQMTFADSEHGPLYLYHGTHEERGPALYSAVTTPAGQVRLRFRYSRIGKGSFVMESQRSVDDGATWETTGRAEYLRAGDAPR